MFLDVFESFCIFFVDSSPNPLFFHFGTKLILSPKSNQNLDFPKFLEDFSTFRTVGLDFGIIFGGDLDWN